MYNTSLYCIVTFSFVETILVYQRNLFITCIMQLSSGKGKLNNDIKKRFLTSLHCHLFTSLFIFHRRMHLFRWKTSTRKCVTHFLMATCGACATSPPIRKVGWPLWFNTFDLFDLYKFSTPRLILTRII